MYAILLPESSLHIQIFFKKNALTTLLKTNVLTPIARFTREKKRSTSCIIPNEVLTLHRFRKGKH